MPAVKYCIDMMQYQTAGQDAERYKSIMSPKQLTLSPAEKEKEVC